MSSTHSKKELVYDAVSSGDNGNTAPVDTGNLAYIVMFYEGVGNLFPWNAFITASAYFAIRFCGTPFGDSFENYFSFSYTLAQTIGLALSVKFQNSLSLQSKIVYPLLIYSMSFLTTTILVTIDADPNLLFWVTLLQTALCGTCGAILSGGLFGLGALFPPSYTGALMSGQGLAGLIVSLSNVLTLLASDPGDDCSDADNTTETCESYSLNYSALAYFIIATLILGTCCMAYFVLKRLPYTRYHIEHASREQNQHLEPLLASEAEIMEDSVQVNPVLRGSDVDTSGELFSSKTADDMSGHVSLAKIWSVYRTLLVPALSVTATFTITIGLFPSLTVFMESENKCKGTDRFSNDLFVPIQFFLFNLFDLCGRLTAGAIRPLFSAQRLWIPAVLRLVFFPCFLLCNVSNSQLPVLFNNDFFPIFFMICFAFSNGYVASLCMMLGPTLIDKRDAALAGTIMIFSLTVGLLGGACTSFVSVYISQGSI